MSKHDPLVAAVRFGLGPRPGDLDEVAGDPRGWVLHQLEAGDADADAALRGPPRSEASVARLVALRQADEDDKRMFREAQRDTFAEEHALHLRVAAGSTTPCRERLAAFWSNHFTVSITRNEVTGVAAAFEREVVRANLDGHFADMLLASTRHPAMLAYLDNFRSLGPDSKAGRRTGRGLNENLAREVLELHTLGVGGGYTQDDVLALAEVLTGWGIDMGDAMSDRVKMALGATPANAGQFQFVAGKHQPGTKALLGTRYAEGQDGGERALRDLARHPSTAHHVATRLVRHFVADDPPRRAVDAVAKVFLDSDGHLPTVAAAVVARPEAWSDPLCKLKTPVDLVLSTARALDYPDQGDVMLKSLKFLGQTPHQAPSPQGWPDTAAAWLGPEAVLSRVEWAEQVAHHAGRDRTTDVPALAEQLLGPALSKRTAKALKSETDGKQALALLLASPEFQRR